MNIPQTPGQVNPAATTPSFAPVQAVTIAARKFYRIVLRLARKTGYAYSSFKKLVEMAEKCVRSVRAYLAELSAAGWIHYFIDNGGDTGRRVYIITPLFRLPEKRVIPAPPSAVLCRSVAQSDTEPGALKSRGSFIDHENKGQTTTAKRETKAVDDVVVPSLEKKPDPLPPVVQPLLDAKVSVSFVRQHLDKLLCAKRNAALLAWWRAKGKGIGLLVCAIRDGWEIETRPDAVSCHGEREESRVRYERAPIGWKLNSNAASPASASPPKTPAPSCTGIYQPKNIPVPPA